MKVRMRHLFIVLICLACLGHGLRTLTPKWQLQLNKHSPSKALDANSELQRSGEVQHSSEHASSNGTFDGLESLARLFLAFSPLAYDSLSRGSVNSIRLAKLDTLRCRAYSPSAYITFSSDSDVAIRFGQDVRQTLQGDGVLLIDGDNTRGRAEFGLTHLHLMVQVARWAKHQKLAGRVVLFIDHGSEATAHHLLDLAGVSVVFAGPDRTTDDVIVRDLDWFFQSGYSVHLITRDNGLAYACRSTSRNYPEHKLWCSSPDGLLASLGFVRPNRDLLTDRYHAASRASSAPVSELPISGVQLKAIEFEMYHRSRYIKAQRMGKMVTVRSTEKAVRTAIKKSESVGAPLLADVVSVLSGDDFSNESHLEDAAQKTISLNTPAQEAIMSKLIQRRAESDHKNEHTTQRVVLAEVLRRRLVRRSAQTAETPAAAYSKMYNDRKPGDKRRIPSSSNVKKTSRNKVAPAKEGREVASSETKPQPDSVVLDSQPESIPLESLARSAQISSPPLPLRSLVVRAEDKTRPIVGSVNPYSKSKSVKGSRKQRKLQKELAASAMQGQGKKGKADQTPWSMQEVQTMDTHKMVVPPAGKASKYVRLVIVSDTHGYERMLTGTSSNGEEGLLPPGDILVHCGDWAYGESPIPKKNATALALFDEWLSRQPQPHKIVLRGNHDPTDVSFPLSEAVYVTRKMSVELGGIKFGCVPYSAGDFGQRLLPEGEVLLTHRPPYKVLDRIYDGKEVGDVGLKNAVKHSFDKPRLWLFGHIHEDAGAVRMRFGRPDVDATTLVNAANANPGIAKRMVLGPLVLDLELEDEF